MGRGPDWTFFQRRQGRQSEGTWTGARHHQSSDAEKPQVTASHLLGRLLSKRQQIMNPLASLWKGNRVWLVGMNTAAAAVENSTEVPQKRTNRTTTSSSSRVSGYLPEGTKTTNSERYLCPDVHCSVIHSSREAEATCVHWHLQPCNTGVRALIHPQKEVSLLRQHGWAWRTRWVK